MKKTFRKHLQIGLVSLSAIGLLAACGTDGNDADPDSTMPAVEEQEETTDDSLAETTQETVDSQTTDAYADISIQPEEAFDIYLEEYPNAKITEVHSEKEDGMYIYQIEGFEETIEYEITINPIDGTILKTDTDTDSETEADREDLPLARIHAEKVKPLVDQALTAAGEGATLEEWALDMDGALAKLEIDLNKQDGTDEEHTYNVDTGELLEIDN